MNATKKSANRAKESNTVATMNATNNLPEVEVIDATTTKGKVSAKFNLNDQTAAEENLNKIDKNQLFSVELNDYFCPVKFDASELENSLSPLVSSGILSEDAKNAAIEKAKKEFLDEHAEEIAASQNLSFSEVLMKLQENETLYKKVLTACNVQELKESNYIAEGGKVQIFRASQCLDKEGKDRYTDATLTTSENGMKFVQPLFVEYREQNTTNILLSIRYFASKQNAQKSLYNKLTEYRRILNYVFDAAMKARKNGFSIEQVTEKVNEAFRANLETE